MHKPTVLVVDDSVTVRTIIQRTLQQDSLTLTFAADGLSALAAVADVSPAVILLDIHLAYMDGFAICQQLRKKALYRDIPIVMLTSKNGLFDRMCGRLVGATDYLTKPFDPEVLVRVVQKHLTNWQERSLIQQEDIQPRTRRYWTCPVSQRNMISAHSSVSL